MDILIVSPLFLALVPVIIALVQLSKMYINSKWAPLVALVLGIAGCILLGNEPLGHTVLQGIVVGLSAAGLYSGTRSVVSN